MLVFAIKNEKKSPVFQGKDRRQYDNIDKGFDAEKQDLAIFNAKIIKPFLNY